jgi:tetraacyldisaccharide-1-P 4'-kinase
MTEIHESLPDDEAVGIKRQRVGREAAFSSYRDHVGNLEVGGDAAVGVVVELHHLVDVRAVEIGIVRRGPAVARLCV